MATMYVVLGIFILLFIFVVIIMLYCLDYYVATHLPR